LQKEIGFLEPTDELTTSDQNVRTNECVARVRYPLNMAIEVVLTDDPALVLETAEDFLALEPVLHNLVLSILYARISNPEPGRYWVVKQQDEILGVALQSPLRFAATLTPMKANAV
jgi:hypothetical protein